MTEFQMCTSVARPIPIADFSAFPQQDVHNLAQEWASAINKSQLLKAYVLAVRQQPDTPPVVGLPFALRQKEVAANSNPWMAVQLDAVLTIIKLGIPFHSFYSICRLIQRSHIAKGALCVVVHSS